jgi:adhesin HecA-like repeat protein
MSTSACTTVEIG